MYIVSKNNYLPQAIQEQMVAHGAEPVNFDDVKDEIFDMIRPEHPSRITLQDLIRSGHGHTAVSILLELHGFWAYENREALAAAGDHAWQEKKEFRKKIDITLWQNIEICKSSDV